MEKARGTLLGRIRIIDDKVSVRVNLQYEAAYTYSVINSELFDHCIKEKQPQDVLSAILEVYIARAFQQVYPYGMTEIDIDTPNRAKMVENVMGMAQECWKYLGVELSTVSFGLIKADAETVEYARNVIAALIEKGVKTEDSQKMICPYCDSAIIPDADDCCPNCAALLTKTEE